MTLANRITISRMCLSLAVFVFIVIGTLWAQIVALVLLTIASISDGIDGAIARRTMTTTPFGAIADPYADKILVMSVFLAYASIKDLGVPIWAVFLILLRELTISTLRVLAALNGEVMKAETTGKIKTTIQLIAAFTIMVLLIIKTWAVTPGAPAIPAPLPQLIPLTPAIVWWLTVIAAAFTLYSGLMYLHGHRQLIYTSWSHRKHQ
jgi:CDP-diacylglycerol--glycerol-3-phosphate 3-phosphatidyltransferase